MKLSISFFKSIYSLEETINKINDCTYDGYVHVDVCDGKYVDAKETDLKELVVVLKRCTKPLDIHLMVERPLIFINVLKHLNPSIISVHVDSLDDLNEVSKVLKESNIKMGLVLNPDDDIYLLDKYIDLPDQILVMSVYPGKGGQKFMSNIPYKLEHLKEYLNGINKLVEVDGGINNQTIGYVKDYVDTVVCGSYICCSEDYQEKINELKKYS